MPCASSCNAQSTISSTPRLWPRWITSQPDACRMRRMMLIDASWPSNSEAAVTNRTLFTGLWTSGFWAIDRSVIGNLFSCAGGRRPGPEGRAWNGLAYRSVRRGGTRVREARKPAPGSRSRPDPD